MSYLEKRRLKDGRTSWHFVWNNQPYHILAARIACYPGFFLERGRQSALADRARNAVKPRSDTVLACPIENWERATVWAMFNIAHTYGVDFTSLPD